MIHVSFRSVVLLILALVCIGFLVVFSSAINLSIQQNRQILHLLSGMELEHTNQMTVLRNDIKFENLLVRLEIAEVEDEITSRMNLVETGLSTRIITTKRHIQSDIGKIDNVYTSLLNEQKKRTVDDVYLEDTTTTRAAEGIALYRQGKYREAHNALQSISIQIADNHEALFCMVASLYEVNPLDSSKYPEINRTLRDLVSKGYWNQQIDTILEQIDAEKKIAIPTENVN